MSPGTPEERGLAQWREEAQGGGAGAGAASVAKVYGGPYSTLTARLPAFAKLPFCPPAPRTRTPVNKEDVELTAAVFIKPV